MDAGDWTARGPKSTAHSSGAALDGAGPKSTAHSSGAALDGRGCWLQSPLDEARQCVSSYNSFCRRSRDVHSPQTARCSSSSAPSARAVPRVAERTTEITKKKTNEGTKKPPPYPLPPRRWRKNCLAAPRRSRMLNRSCLVPNLRLQNLLQCSPVGGGGCVGGC